MEDKLLILRCKRHSKAALTRVYQKYKKHLLILAVALLNDAGCAEDVVHDVFLRFVQTLNGFELTGSLRGYLATCVANRARNINKAKHQSNVSLDGAEPVADPACEPICSIACNEQLGQLAAAMAGLPYEQREAILLHLHSGETFRAIAARLNVSVNTVKSRYRYGLDKLRSILDQEKDQ